MTAPKFKVGDRVRHLPEHANDMLIGEGVVLSAGNGDGRDLEVDLGELCGIVYPEDSFAVLLAEPPTKNPNPKKAFGAQKPDLALIPPVALLHMAMAFENGAAKYGAFNWRKDPVEAMTYLAAQMRHAGLFLDGQDYSSDAMVHNLGHVMACCAILIDSQELGILIDNRPAAGKSEEVQQRLKEQKMKALK